MEAHVAGTFRPSLVRETCQGPDDPMARIDIRSTCLPHLEPLVHAAIAVVVPTVADFGRTGMNTDVVVIAISLTHGKPISVIVRGDNVSAPRVGRPSTEIATPDDHEAPCPSRGGAGSIIWSICRGYVGPRVRDRIIAAAEIIGTEAAKAASPYNHEPSGPDGCVPDPSSGCVDCRRGGPCVCRGIVAPTGVRQPGRTAAPHDHNAPSPNRAVRVARSGREVGGRRCP